MLDPELQLIAGTSWLFSREELDQHVDTLFVDEGGQVALADALAVGTAARNLDPARRPEPAAAGLAGLASAGRGRVGARAPARRRRDGAAGHGPLPRADVADAAGGERLHLGDVLRGAARAGGRSARERSVELGNGIRFLAGRARGPPAGRRRRRRRRSRRRSSGCSGRRTATRTASARSSTTDIVVVAPYNAHVRCLREQIPDARIRIGTVDKFQGQQAPVVFYSMASSSGEDVPRGLDFLFSRNRLNVAISRAKCLAYLVCSPRLLDANCRTVEQMRLANALCRLVEFAVAPVGSAGL